MLKTVSQVIAESKWDKATFYRYAGREEDPLPIRYVGDSRRCGRIVDSEFEEWFLRNSTLYRDRKKEKDERL